MIVRIEMLLKFDHSLIANCQLPINFGMDVPYFFFSRSEI